MVNHAAVFQFQKNAWKYMEILLLHESGMVEMEFFTECKHKIKKTKLQDVEIKNFVLFIKT